MGLEMRGRRNRIKYFLLDTTRALFNLGRGKSKHEAMQQSYEKYETRETEAIYSYSTFNRYEKAIAKFADFLRDEMNVKYERDFRRLSDDELYYCVDKYFEKQKQEGLAQNTLEIHISALAKVLPAIKPEIKEYFTAESRSRWRDGEAVGDNDRYNNSSKVLENLRKIDETSYVVAKLQLLTGARIGDVKKITVDEEGKKIKIEGSKGGRDRSVYYDHFPKEFEEVKQLKEKLDDILREKKFSEIRENEYYDNLRRACRKSDEIYRGAHAFRYEFAQQREERISKLSKEEQEQYYVKILEERGKSDKEIEKALEYVREKDAVDIAIISEELGHSRLDISMHYLKMRRK